MTTPQTNSEFDNALGILAQQTFESNRSLFREAVKAHPENYTDETTAALEATAFPYEIALEYDGGDFIADVDVSFFRNGRPVGRITCTVIPTLGSRKLSVRGRSVLQYDIEKIKNWRVYCAVNSDAGFITVSWSGMWGENIGNCVASPIPPRGVTLGAGKVM